MRSHTFTIGSIAHTLLFVVLILALPVGAIAEPFEPMIFPLSIRASGMGETGTADYRDAANLAYNPATISMLDGLQVTWSHSNTPYRLADVDLDGYLAGGGYGWNLQNDLHVRCGLAVHYARERYGNPGYDYLPPDREPYNRSYGAGAGMAVEYEEMFTIGGGLNLKWWKWDNNQDTPRRQILDATVVDAGVTATATVLRRNDYAIVGSAGFAYANFGGSIKIVESPIYLPSTDDIPAPEYRRYGMSVRFESPSWDRADERLQAVVPAFSAAFNYDIVDEVFRSNHAGPRHAIGGEIGILETLFLRLGRISQAEHVYAAPFTPGGKLTVVDITYGVGLALNYQRYHLRFDYARRDFDELDIDQNRYGLLVAVTW